MFTVTGRLKDGGTTSVTWDNGAFNGPGAKYVNAMARVLEATGRVFGPEEGPVRRTNYASEPLSALFTPTVNSFKRINAAPTVSGATWSPNAISYGGNNRTHMVRIPEPGRFELRLMDGAANPYLLQAGLLAGGLDGIVYKRDPGKRLDVNMYEPGSAPAGVPRLPLNVLDALRAFAASAMLVLPAHRSCNVPGSIR